MFESGMGRSIDSTWNGSNRGVGVIADGELSSIYIVTVTLERTRRDPRRIGIRSPACCYDDDDLPSFRLGRFHVDTDENWPPRSRIPLSDITRARTGTGFRAVGSNRRHGELPLRSAT